MTYKELNQLRSRFFVLRSLLLDDHEDLGIIDGEYVDAVICGRKCKLIYSDTDTIDSACNPHLARMEKVKQAVKTWLYQDIVVRNLVVDKPISIGRII